MTEREALILLNMMEKVGPICVRALSDHLGSVSAIMEAGDQSLQGAAGVGPELARAIMRQRETLDLAAELARAEEHGARIVTQVDEEYPRALLDIHDPPLALYVRGTLNSRDRQAIAVVGTRRPTHYGRGVAQKMAGGLARAGFTIISGLAEGIDTVAHHAALDAQGRTLAVIGGALDCLYPRSNAALVDRIVEQGAVISEFPFGRRPDKTTFPMRNRVVSGLALGVLVVEAGQKSGALITVRQALEQGRSVFAVPGRIDSPSSQGCHALIRDGAMLVTDVREMLEEFEFLIPRSELPSNAAPTMRAPLTAQESSLVRALEQGEQDVDALIRASGLDAASVSGLLLMLEMKKVVRMLPGRMVELRQ